MKHRIVLAGALCCLSIAYPAYGDDTPPAPERVTFKASDGVEVVGSFYAPPKTKKKAPCAILIHMYPAEKSSWQPLIPYLHGKGFAVLAYDIRGAGESVLPQDKYL